MRNARRPIAALVIVALVSATATPSFAAPPPAPAPPAAKPAAPSAPSATPPVAPPAAAVTQSSEPEDSAAQRQAEARDFFDRGLALYEKEAWDAALGEFTQSRKVFVTRAATKYAASCLRALQRYDEALDMFEEVMTFPNLSDKDRAYAEQGIAEVSAKVGQVSITGGEAGMSVVIDGRYRGALPITKPLRVAAGTHEVGAFKEGRDPFGAIVTAEGQKTVVAQLSSQAKGGRLKIAEQKQRSLDVLIDGVVVGKTPWEGALSVGEHFVTLQGHVSSAECVDPEQAKKIKPNEAASVEVGTQPVTVPIKLRELTTLTLLAEELDTVLRVEPMPGGAKVAVDSVVVGHGTWEGRLRVGEHKVEVIADGFLPVEQRVSLVKQKRAVMKVELTRDPNTAEWRSSRNRWIGASWGVGAAGLAVFGVSGALALGKSNDLRTACSGNICPPSQADNLSQAHTYGVISTVGLVVGLVGAAAGTTILLVSKPPSAERRPNNGVTITASVDGLYGTF